VNTLTFGRRTFGLGALAALTACAAKGRSAGTFETRIADQEAATGGRVGVAVLDTGTGRRFAYRSYERFAMCSTFKWVLAAAVLANVDAGRLRLDQRVPYSSADLLSHAPVTGARVADGGLPVAALCKAAVEVSDNTAANLLLRLIGGPAGFTEFVRVQADDVTRLDRAETELNTNIPGDPRDTTTPDAMVGLMAKILAGDALLAATRDRLLGWMKAGTTGLNRLRAGLPADWVVGDKTGSGANGAANDVAVAWPPGRAPILTAVYMTGSSAPPETLDAAHAAIGRLVAELCA
jgi:beta-lactamase class A